MSNTNSKINLKALLTLMIIMMLSLILAFASSCGNNNESDSESESESESESASDVQTISNGDFEWKTTSSSVYPVSSSSINWTKKTDSKITTALTSTSGSGIIDTNSDAYKSMSDSYKPVASETDGTKTYYNPGTPYSAEKITADELAAYTKEGVDADGTKILMLHNQTATDLRGTAQYFKSSSSMTLEATGYSMLSIWIQTYQLKSLQNSEYGAYIQINNTVSSTIAPLVIKNINTDGAWVKFVIYLKPSDTAVTKYSVSLGLGMGSKFNREEYVEGFAFFDNVEYKTITASDYSAATANKSVNLFNGNNVNQTVEEIDDETNTAYNANTFIVDEYKAAYTATETVKLNLSKTLSSTEILNKIGSGTGAYNNIIDNFTTPDVAHYDAGYTAAAKTSNFTYNGAQNSALEVPANSVYMNFKNVNIGSSYTYTTTDFTLESGKFMKLSFLAKVSTMNGTTDASAAIIDNGKDSASGIFSSFNTNSVEDDNGLDGYVRYTFYIGNTFPEAFTFRVRLSFGPTEKITNTITLPVGYAIFKDFATCAMSSDEYSAADVSTDKSAVKCKLLGSYLADYKKDEDEEKDEYATIKADSYSFAVKDEFLPELKNGAVNYLSDYSIESSGKDSDEVCGIVNSYYANTYATKYNSTLIKDTLNELKAAQSKYGTNINVQPFMLYSQECCGLRQSSYTTLSANTTYIFSAKVKVAGGAKAYIYLVDTDLDEDDIKNGNISYSTMKFSGNNAEMVATVDENTALGVDGYATVTFIIKTGNESKKVRLEMWNGPRENTDQAVQGVVFIDSPVLGTTVSYSDISDVENTYNGYSFDTANYYSSKPVKVYSYYDKYYESDTSKNEIVEDDDGNPVYTYTVAEVIYATANNKTLQFYRYDTIDADNYKIVESDSSSETESTESSSTASLSDTAVNYGWLQIVSIIISLILIFLLCAIIFRKIRENIKKKKAKTDAYYEGYNKDERYIPSPKDDDKEYNYDDIDSNVDTEEKTEDSSEKISDDGNSEKDKN